MASEKINTIAIQQFISQVKSADAGRQREVRLDIDSAKNLAFTLGVVMSRLAGDYETLITKSDSAEEDVIQVQLDGGNNWK